jgi:type II secretory pathway pseudopilin PulG
VTDRGVSRDGGFTLLETIVVVLLVAVLSSVIAAVVAVIIRNVPATETRTDETRSYQALVNWLPRDVASTPPDGFVPPSPPSTWSCSGISGPKLVEMSGTHLGKAYIAGYQRQTDGDGVRVMRYTCSGSSSDTVFSNTRITKVTGRLNHAEVDPIDPSDPIVRMRLTTCGETDGLLDCGAVGPEISVEARSRNPGETLPPVTP